MCVYIFLISIFCPLLTIPLTLFLRVLATDFQSRPPAKPTHREAPSSALPEPAQQTKGRWKIPGVPIWTFKWSFSVTQICEICIFSFLCRAMELRQCNGSWWGCCIENALENYNQQRMNLGSLWKGLRTAEILVIIIPPLSDTLSLKIAFTAAVLFFNSHLGIGVGRRLHGFASILQILK